MPLRTDSDLIRAYAQGDSGAFESLVSRHTDAIFAYIARLTGDRDAATDITQETFVKAWKNLDRFREGESFKTWIFTIARNTAFDWLRKKKNVPFSAMSADAEHDTFSETIVDPEPLPDALFAHAESGRFLENLLKEISPDSRDILLLHYVDEMTFDEIGTMRGESLNTVKSRHRRALIALGKAARENAPEYL